MIVTDYKFRSKNTDYGISFIGKPYRQYLLL